MAAVSFHIASPDQLQSMVRFTKDRACTVSRMARIWKGARDRKGETHWDKRIFACFSGDRSRDAAIYQIARRANGDELAVVGRLKYNLALRWCEQHLRPVSQDEGTGFDAK